jgi:phosphate-selective porin
VSAVLACALAALLVHPLAAQQRPSVGHGSRGFFIETADGNWRTELQFRMQFRFSTPYDGEPTSAGAFGTESASFDVRRARLKIGGHGFQPWLSYYFEYDVPSSSLLNWTLEIEKNPKASVRLGQWKAYYSRERVVSSGRQQFVDRSIVNRPFTIDRQMGVSLYGRLGEGSVGDFNYWVSAFTGMGRGVRSNDDQKLMYMARLQWNPFGRAVGFAGGDLARSEDVALSIAVAATTNRSACTRFSGSGCGSLAGFATDASRYRVNQGLIETALLYKGFSWTQEYHIKKIDDRVADTETDLRGNYAQIGYFPVGLIEDFPEELELAVRYSFYRPDNDVDDNRYDELSFGANWFFSGHSNKLTAEVTRFDATFQPGTVTEDGTRFRLQWDIQF